jgi:hypothetical protein
MQTFPYGMMPAGALQFGEEPMPIVPMAPAVQQILQQQQAPVPQMPPAPPMQAVPQPMPQPAPQMPPGFLSMLLGDSGQAPAPIQEQGVQAQPMRTGPAPIQERGVPAEALQPAPIEERGVQAQAQAQPGAPGFDMQKMGPMMTFLQAMATPLAPWETTGSRMGQAFGLMQMHQSMLDANARNRPREEELQNLEMRKARAGVESAELGIGDAKRKAKLGEATMQADIDKALMTVENLKRQGRLQEAQLLEQEIENKYADELARLNVAVKRRAANAPYSGQGGGGGTAAAAKTAEQSAALDNLRLEYEANIWTPYMEWARQERAADPQADVSESTFYATFPEKKQLFMQWNTAFRKAGGKMERRKGDLATGAAAPGGGGQKKASYKLNADGTLTRQ